ncbi:hypothetical protein CASFOL_002357 [Castilleja foliolosa]|uniref:WAT1-related protein n=1 Tax=Castilleja foliolosa TaxID=1961234 RepID=A0ABD3EHJ8_9LAMI
MVEEDTSVCFALFHEITPPLLSWIETTVNLKSVRSHAKILGTLVTVGGAMIMTLIPSSEPGADPLERYRVHGNPEKIPGSATARNHSHILGREGKYFCVGPRMGCQTFSLCLWGSDLFELFYRIGPLRFQQEKGPVFVTAFNPLSMVIVAIMSPFIFAEQMTVGKISGATVIVIGLYLVIWGKNKDQKENTEPTQQQQQESKDESNTSDDSKTELSNTITGPDAV